MKTYKYPQKAQSILTQACVSLHLASCQRDFEQVISIIHTLNEAGYPTPGWFLLWLDWYSQKPLLSAEEHYISREDAMSDWSSMLPKYPVANELKSVLKLADELDGGNPALRNVLCVISYEILNHTDHSHLDGLESEFHCKRNDYSLDNKHNLNTLKLLLLREIQFWDDTIKVVTPKAKSNFIVPPKMNRSGATKGNFNQ